MRSKAVAHFLLCCYDRLYRNLQCFVTVFFHLHAKL